MTRLSPLSLVSPLAVTFAVGVPAWQAWSGWGMSAAEFSGQGDATLRAASYAFSIWSVIYVGLGVFAVAHAWRVARDRFFQSLTWPAAIAICGCGVWILASAANARWVTVGVIIGSALAAAIAAVLAGRASSMIERWTTWGLPLLGGWLLVASTLNVSTIATAEGLLTPANAAVAAAVAVLVVVGVSAWLIGRGASVLYAVPPAWGLAAVAVAEWARHPGAAILAVAGAAGLAALAAWHLVKRLRPSR